MFRIDPHPDDPIWQWWDPDPSRLYSIGVDVADGGGHGSRFGSSNDGSRPCASTIEVIDAATRFQVLEVQLWSLLPHDFGLLVADIGRWYGGKTGEAHVVVEANKSGISVLDAMRYEAGYSNLYTRRTFDFVTQKWMNKIGWSTDPKTRPILVNQARKIYQELPEVIMSQRLQEEVRSFIYQETSPGSGDFKPKAAPGELDDLVIAWSLAQFGADYALAEQTEEQKPLDVDPDHWVWKTTDRILDVKAQSRHYGTFLDPDEIIAPGQVTVPDHFWEV